MILVIDDNPGFSRVISRMLSSVGYQVKVTDTAEAGLGLLCEADIAGNPYELALIDYKLGGPVDGIELAHQARERGSQTKFVLISGEFQGGETGESSGLCLRNFEVVIGKPILATELVEMVNRYTGRNMALPFPKEITAAAADAGLDVSPVPPPEDDGTG